MCARILECRDVLKRFGRATAVNGLNLTLNEGAIYALLGPSGCGKSTTLRLIAGLAVPDKGTITLRDKLVNNPRILVAPEQRGIAMVFQTLALWPHMTVEKNLTFVVPELGRAERKREAYRRLEAFGLVHRGSAYPHELSEGERQRVALARALMKRPDILLLDEPFANLDRPLKRVILDEIKAIRTQESVTVLLVTHDAEEALSVADRLLVMHQGTIVQEGQPDQVFRAPAFPFVMHLLGHGGLVRGHAQNGSIASPLGVFSSKDNGTIPEGQVFLAFRPGDLSLAPAGQGTQARVAGGHYEGERWQWQVDVGDDALSIWGSGPPPVGQVVWLRATGDPAVIPGRR